MKRLSIFTAAICCGTLLCANADAQVVIADAAADYVTAAGSDTGIITTPPTGWTYLASDSANGGTEVELVAGQVGNQGAAPQGFAGNSVANTPAVYGTNTVEADEFEIFGDGQANGGVVGEDLLLHPGSTDPTTAGTIFDPANPNVDDGESFLIVRYTVSDPAGSLVAGTGEVTGSFRELVAPSGDPNNNNGGSVDVFVYQNGTQLFTFDTVPQDSTGPAILTQADGTFDVTGLTLADGDTIDFVVFNNGLLFGDETALQASISAETSDTGGVLGDASLNGVVDFDDIGPFIALLASEDFLDQADIDRNGFVNFDDIGPFITLLASQ